MVTVLYKYLKKLNVFKGKVVDRWIENVCNATDELTTANARIELMVEEYQQQLN